MSDILTREETLAILDSVTAIDESFLKGMRLLRDSDVAQRIEIERLTAELKEAHESHDEEARELSVEIADLRAKLEAAEKDTARLNWLEKRRCAFNRHYSTEYGWKFVTSPHVNRLHVADCTLDLNDANAKGSDIRAAIDAAMKEKP